jgi:hypothetical protein
MRIAGLISTILILEKSDTEIRFSVISADANPMPYNFSRSKVFPKYSEMPIRRERFRSSEFYQKPFIAGMRIAALSV